MRENQGARMSPELTGRPANEFPAYSFTPTLEAEISRLDGVLSTRVLSSGGNIEEIHVIAENDRPPKKLVRNIESLLLIKFNVRIDHRKISIAPVGRGSSSAFEAYRPHILTVKAVDAPDGTQVQVELERGKEIISGTGRAGPGENELHASSRALIDAIGKLLNAQTHLRLVDVNKTLLGGLEIVVVLVEWSVSDEYVFLVGAASSRGEPLQAAARATFDALNRKLVRIGTVNANIGPVAS